MRLCAALSTILATIVLAGASAPAAADDRGRSHSRLEITTLSTGPDRVSGGDVLVGVNVPAATALSEVEVFRNGTEVTGVLVPDAAHHVLIRLVSSLTDGRNVRRARTRGRPAARSRARAGTASSASRSAAAAAPRTGPDATWSPPRSRTTRSAWASRSPSGRGTRSATAVTTSSPPRR